MDKETSSTAGPTCASCEECTAGATINLKSHADALNRCVRRTVGHGIASVKDKINGHIASAKERAREKLDAAQNRAKSYWTKFTGRITGSTARLFDTRRISTSTESNAVSGISMEFVLGATSVLWLALLIGLAGKKMLRSRQYHSSSVGSGAGVEELGLLH
mmetsp:Transcript_9915/g.11082  ORF Transcript_9915/g.11082 Transcript_9915/m.11082 type:complete len:161 (+) Transcript_9915:170-652(+)